MSGQTKCVQIVLWASNFNPLGYLSWSGIDGWHGNSMFSVSGCTISHSHQQNTTVSLFQIGTNICLLGYFFSFFKLYEVISHGFDLHFPSDLWCWTYFNVPIDHSYIFFWKNVYSSLCLLFNQVGLFFVLLFSCWVVGVLYILWTLIPFKINGFQIFPSIPYAAFSFY